MADYQFISLPSKPTGKLCYSFEPSAISHSSTRPILTVFLNGLGVPQAGWVPAITKLKELRRDKPIPSILTYDRFGQGQTTDRDPNDEGVPDPMHGHDCLAVVRDLRELISTIAREKMSCPDVDSVTLILVSNSIGGALSRLYAQEYPGTVAGLLILDCVLANSDFISVFPDPDAEGFDASSLPAGISPDALRASRENIGKIFHPDVGSREGLSRKNLRTLLPASDAPLLKGPAGQGPFVTVVGHDFDAFAEESIRLGQPAIMTKTYTNPYWHAYNEGLVKITKPKRSKGPLQAPNAGHFVQKDNPDFVAKELDEILSKIIVE